MEFSFEERHLIDIPVMTGSNIRAKRCEECGLIYFVNISMGEWKKCMRCRKSKGIEIKETDMTPEPLSDEEGDFP